jgi:Tol biopolymer transport system component
MKPISILTFLIFGVLSFSLFAQNSYIDYFGQVPPGDSAIIFAPGVISLPNRNEQSIVFSPDGKDCFFGEWATDYSYAKIYYTEYINKSWTLPVGVLFSVGHFANNPFFSADGNRLYFHYASYSGSEPYDIWMVKRTSLGWCEPIHLP